MQRDVDARGRFLTRIVAVVAIFFFASGSLVLYLVTAPGLTTVEAAPTLPTVPTIVVAGDSLTQYGLDPTVLGYHTLLAQSYMRRADVLNRGFAGWTTSDFLAAAVPPMVAEMAPPLLLTLLLGTNDAVLPGNMGHASVAAYMANLEAILTAFQNAFPSTKLLLLTPPPVVDAVQAGQHSNAVLAAYVRGCKQVGAARNVPVLDVFGTWSNRSTTSYYLSDGIHLAAAGNRALHELLVQAIASSYPALSPNALRTFFVRPKQ
ncbi:hypothetical protein SPRG_07792 [Saprolegnia parasitica CBS 223.65]|uniref:SGNH hydrolase-type esterase domain-containing protein n=1 Tax=Saprolegnia parasitica (strain CBS 223.65) TaxID=695850 RepID=A0A067CJV2_SAPPC|nr:hypothetical protein SPRG_07792 [Saprolegnia parasitica CBS 223.65]KDO27082.1 hypothetical protein SPRG_07792 [Saprolegnia parasitica CBS 223.65]|eukprot:XP_012202176.1 hypothetical protein SPRG_07792 [Saprolegnia parasitica CBS 223.65]